MERKTREQTKIMKQNVFVENKQEQLGTGNEGKKIKTYISYILLFFLAFQDKIICIRLKIMTLDKNV